MKRRLFVDTLIVSSCQILLVSLFGYFIWLAFTLLASGGSEYVDSIQSSTGVAFIFLTASVIVITLVLWRRRKDPTTGRFGIYIGLVGLCPIVLVASVWTLFPKTNVLTDNSANLLTIVKGGIDLTASNRRTKKNSLDTHSTRPSHQWMLRGDGDHTTTANSRRKQNIKLPALTVELTMSGSKAVLNDDGTVFTRFDHKNYDHGWLSAGFVSQSKDGMLKSVVIPHNLTSVIQSRTRFGASTYGYGDQYYVWEKETGNGGLRLEELDAGELLLYVKNWTRLLGWKHVEIAEDQHVTEKMDLDLSKLGRLQLEISYASPAMASKVQESSKSPRPARERFLIKIYPMVEGARLGPIEFPIFGSKPTSVELFLPAGRYDVRCGNGGLEVEVESEGVKAVTLVEGAPNVNERAL